MVRAARERYPDISIHALREEGDDGSVVKLALEINFYPRPPRGGRPRRIGRHEIGKRFLSTPSARRATVSICLPVLTRAYFYPRPPRGGRPLSSILSVNTFAISIHALREEGDVGVVYSARGVEQFLSTPSARRATTKPRQRARHRPISIHALREEGDSRPPSFVSRSRIFLSTPSARRATAKTEKNISAFVSL